MGKGRITTIGNSVPKSNKVQSTDLRGSMALIIAAILADGESEIKMQKWH